ncbi:MAG TPA: Nif3-like dinuclear metal center hexameric protein [Gemmatimonadaceae bacterium]|nr:Nif3-like dinuclear metal center hexameric protein [Gemmatimonadaceae bacterium]
MTALTQIVHALDEFFDVPNSGADPAFSRFLPAVYGAAPRPWTSWVESAFATHFNGLMLRGDETVRTVFLAAFPSEHVLDALLDRAESGDLLFVHHPIDLKSGDPRGTWGNFFQPIADETLAALQAKRVSIYSCHAPLDYHPTLNTSGSIARALGATVTGHFFPYGSGHAGVIASMPSTPVELLQERLRHLFGVPYLDAAGARTADIERLAIVAGSGDRVDEMQNAERLGAQAYVTGEIHSRIDTEYGRRKFAAVEGFAESTRMALFGVSHAASEFLVMDREIQPWFTERFDVATVPLREEHWWR